MAIVQVLSKREGEIKLGDFSSTLYRDPSAHGWIDKDRVKNLNKEG
jgi:hypothetical protein